MLLLVGVFTYTIGTQSFVVPARIAPGGAIGIALMINYLTQLPVGAVTLAINLPLLLLSWFYLEDDLRSKLHLQLFWSAWYWI